MANYPNMMYELLESVHGYFCDYPDVETDIMRYLCSLRNNLSRTNELANEVESRLLENNKCPLCGSELSNVVFKEYHTELDGSPYELMLVRYCPECNWKEND